MDKGWVFPSDHWLKDESKRYKRKYARISNLGVPTALRRVMVEGI